MGRLKCAVEVDVSSAVPLPGQHVLRGTVVAPPTSAGPLVWCCLPGGGSTSNYFDLAVEGDDTSFSMAARFAKAGDVVLCLDHLGTGASTPLEDDFLLTPAILAAAHHFAFSALLQHLRDGTLTAAIPPMERIIPMGLGHSLGAMITVVQQARHGTYAAVVNLGATGAGLPEHLRDQRWAEVEIGTVRSSLVDMARVQFGSPSGGGNTLAVAAAPPTFHAEDVPASVRAAARDEHTNLLPSCAMATLLPSFMSREQEEITVPLFLGFGEYDLARDPLDSVRSYRSATDVTLVVLAGSGHCHNQAGNRRQLWDRILAWSRSLPSCSRSTGGEWEDT